MNRLKSIIDDDDDYDMDRIKDQITLVLEKYPSLKEAPPNEVEKTKEAPPRPAPAPASTPPRPAPAPASTPFKSPDKALEKKMLFDESQKERKKKMLKKDLDQFKSTNILLQQQQHRINSTTALHTSIPKSSYFNLKHVPSFVKK